MRELNLEILSVSFRGDRDLLERRVHVKVRCLELVVCVDDEMRLRDLVLNVPVKNVLAKPCRCRHLPAENLTLVENL